MTTNYLKVNVNPETGIRYGVAAILGLADWVFDEFFQNGRNLSAEAAFEEWRAENPEADVDDFWDSYEEYEDCYSLETGEMKLGMFYLGGAPLVWVYESPHVTRARLCSPCVPNAGDLDSQDPEGFECYTLPADWFDDGSEQ